MEIAAFEKEFRARRIGLLFDDSGTQSRAIIVSAASWVDEALVNEVLHLSHGILFVAITRERAADFLLQPMARPSTDAPDAPRPSPSLPLTVSVEAREGVSTGISALDRARTIRALGEDPPRLQSLVSPGHIFPLIVRSGGVLVKNALHEGAFDLVRLSGADAALLADCLDEQGEFLSRSQARRLARKARIPFLSLSTLTRYRLEHERIVDRVAEARLPTLIAGELRSIVYRTKTHAGDHLALVKGEVNTEEPVLVRVQSEFTFGDVFGGTNPPSRGLLHSALEEIARRGRGVLLYLRSPEQFQLQAQVQSWQDLFTRRPATMLREYGVGAQILYDLGVRKIELLTSSRKSLVGLKAFGIEVVAQHRFPAVDAPSAIN